MAGKPKDILGQKFGSLTVLEITDERRYGSLVVWNCNVAKSELSQEDFAGWIHSVYNNFWLKQYA